MSNNINNTHGIYSILDKSAIYSCLPVSRSRLYDPEFLRSVHKLSSTKKSSRTQTEKNISYLENEILGVLSKKNSYYLQNNIEYTY